MINKKYYNDMNEFPKQFAEGFKLAKDLKIEGDFEKVLLCGVGGSSFYADLLNDYFAEFSPIRIVSNRNYSLPNWVDDKTLTIVASYSGNTEETLSCLDEVSKQNKKCVVFASGGELLKSAQDNALPYMKIPTGLQPRLSTGYFISGVLKMLANVGLVEDKTDEVLEAASKLRPNLEEENAGKLAKDMKSKVPIVYATYNIKSLARVTKIKLNENSKTQAFWYYFPELNHNEMVGFTNLVMNPYFLVFKSKFSHPSNQKRIQVFKDLFEKRNLPVEVIDLKGENLIEEILNGYHFADYLTYYLAEEYKIDPEPVTMVEEFKELLK